VRLLLAVIRRELLRVVRNQAEMLYPLILFVLCIVLFPFALGADTGLLARVAGAVIWVAALLTAALSLDALYRSDYADGSLEFFATTASALATLALGKAVAHWLLSGLPALALAVPLGAMLGLGLTTLTALAASLALAGVSMSLLGSAIAALTAGLRSGGLLLAMLILPLYIPLLIFGASATASAGLDLPVKGQLYFLAGSAVLALSLAPWAAASAIRIRLH
jgi:heme exporter protein B